MAELAHGREMATSTNTAQKVILKNNKKHLFKRRDTPMTLNFTPDTVPKPSRFVPKISSFEENAETDDKSPAPVKKNLPKPSE